MYTGHCCERCVFHPDYYPGCTYISEVIKSAVEICVVLHYLLVTPMPDQMMTFQPVRKCLMMQVPATQLESWHIIQEARIEELGKSAGFVLGTTKGIKHLRCVMTATEEVKYLKEVVRSAVSRSENGCIKTVSDVVMLKRWLVEWAEAKEGKDDVEKLRLELFNFMKELGGG
ncbi:hypothetical protein HDV00_000854 [Rhizophlyctis rosea]|nr:hypothetical protein HDV00_000854 [Rhizophlyctis rosea]